MTASPEPGFPVAAVARRLGVAPATLRTWDRRYGLGPSEHSAGAHRRYSPEDVARLEVMQRLTKQGIAPADAAQHALSGDEPPVAPVRGHGGPVLPLPGADLVTRGLGRAAMALDAAAVTDIVMGQVHRHGVIPTWEHALRPVLAAVGERWAATGKGVEVEHLLADAVTSALQAVTRSLPTTAPPRPVLLASAPDEQHALPLHALCAGLAERGVACMVLGASMPAQALVDAVRRTGASALFLWSQLPVTADPAVLASLPQARPRTVVVVGGPGWSQVDLPERIGAATDLTSAVSLVLEATGH